MRALLGLFVLATLLVSPAGPAESQPPVPGPPAARVSPPPEPVVLDAENHVVGPLIGVLSPILLNMVRIQVGERNALVVAARERLGGAPAQYESVDCSGPPFIQDLFPVAPVVELGAIGKDTELLITAGDPVTRVIQTEWVTLGLAGPVGCQELQFGPEYRTVRPTSILIGLDAFSPPFRLR